MTGKRDVREAAAKLPDEIVEETDADGGAEDEPFEDEELPADEGNEESA